MDMVIGYTDGTRAFCGDCLPIDTNLAEGFTAISKDEDGVSGLTCAKCKGKLAGEVTPNGTLEACDVCGGSGACQGCNHCGGRCLHCGGTGALRQ